MDKPEIITLERVDSTSSYLKAHPDLWARDFTTVRAIEQTAGRGAHGRSWFTGGGLDCAFSTVYHPPVPSSSIPCITLIAGLAVYLSLREIVGMPLAIKWPNDLHCGGEKIAGILCESVATAGRTPVVIGIGVNVNSTVFPPGLSGKITSIKLRTGRVYDVPVLMADILSRLSLLCAGFTGNLDSVFIEQWIAASDSISKTVRYYPDGAPGRGRILGIGADGSLVLESIPGKKRIAWHGEIVYE